MCFSSSQLSEIFFFQLNGKVIIIALLYHCDINLKKFCNNDKPRRRLPSDLEEPYCIISENRHHPRDT